MTIAILGEGAWGTAWATLMAAQGHTVHLWCYHSDVADMIRATRINQRYLPNIILSERIHPFADIGQALTGVSWVFEAIPVKFLRSVLAQCRAYRLVAPWVILSKGIEQGSLLLPLDIVHTVFADTTTPAAVISGPSFAHDLAYKQLTAVTIAATDNALGDALVALVMGPYSRACYTEDYIGVQVGGALKNVIALALGILKGAGYSDNTQAFAFWQGLREIVRVSRALGGQEKTIYGLAGVADLIVTAYGSKSRNHTVGVHIGQGQSLDAILQATGYIPESINTVVSVHDIGIKYELDLPLMKSMYDIVIRNYPLSSLAVSLSKCCLV